MADLSALSYGAAAAAAVGAGAVNSIAGGGTLISFPVLTAIGVPSVSANATNTVALCPGYVGGTHALRQEIDDSGEPLRTRIIVAGLGGITGALALLLTSNAAFRAVVPYLILLSCLLLAVQDPVRRWIARRGTSGSRLPVLELAGVYLAGAYGGYFGGGLGIMLIAVLGLFSAVPFNQLNAVKQPLAAAVNLAAAAFLIFSGKIEWSLALVMAPASLLGGQLGARLSRHLDPNRFRWSVITIGVAVAVIYLAR